MEHAAPAYYVSRDGVTKEYVRGGRATARRLRRHPTAAELRSLGETPACTATLLGEEGPVIVARKYAETDGEGTDEDDARRAKRKGILRKCG